MVWSVISVFGTSRLQIVKVNMNQDQYKTILESACYLNLMNGPVEEGFQAPGSSYSCTMMFYAFDRTNVY